jgi:hypothetical protein
MQYVGAFYSRAGFILDDAQGLCQSGCLMLTTPFSGTCPYRKSCPDRVYDRDRLFPLPYPANNLRRRIRDSTPDTCRITPWLRPLEDTLNDGVPVFCLACVRRQVGQNL